MASRQRDYQKKMSGQGRCQTCGKDCDENSKSYCTFHKLEHARQALEGYYRRKARLALESAKPSA